MKYVEVILDKKDDMLQDLCKDLGPKYIGLKQSSNENKLVFKGNILEDDLNKILVLCSVSPYGNGYEIYSNGEQIW